MNLQSYFINFFQFIILIPAAILCYLPMKNQLKYSFKRIFLNCLILFLITVPISGIIFTLFNNTDGNIIYFPFLLLFFLYYNSSLKTDLSQSIAVFLFNCSIFSFATTLSYALDAFLYPTNTYLEFGWEASILRLSISMLFLILFSYPLQKFASHLIDNLQIPHVWNLTTIVSVLFIIMNIACIPHDYSTMKVGRVFSMYLVIEISFLALYLFLSVIFYFIAMGILTHMKVAERQRFFEMQENQYNLLKKHMNDIRKIKHDSRQSIHVVSNLAKRKDFESIEKYLEEYEKSLPSIDYIKYCDNNAVDALLNYYAQKEYEAGINMNWQIDLPKTSLLSETDFCSLIGNLIENAIDGSMTMPQPQRKHSLTILTKNKNTLYIVSTNSFKENIKQTNGKYVSTKKDGTGIGISSICMTAEKYGGTANFHHTDNEFCADIILRI